MVCCTMACAPQKAFVLQIFISVAEEPSYIIEILHALYIISYVQHKRDIECIIHIMCIEKKILIMYCA